MTVGELLDRTSSAELTEWAAFAELEEWRSKHPQGPTMTMGE